MLENKDRYTRTKAENGIMGKNASVLWHNFLVAGKQLFWIPLVLMLLLGGFMYLRNRKPGVYTYTSRAVFAVSANYSSSTDILSYNYYYDKAAAKQLSATFPYILSSDAMRLLIQQDLGVETVNGTITASAVADAGLFVLTVTSTSPQDAYTILNAVIRVYPQAASVVLGDTQITIIDEPFVPTAPNESYGVLHPIVMGVLTGALLGVAILFVISLSRKTVHAAEDLRQLVNLPCMAYFPQVHLKKRKNNMVQSITIQNEKTGQIFMESVRSLRHSVTKLMDETEGCKVLMVTSTLPDEGKSTVSTNLALSLAADGKRVILIDADLRNQSLKKTLAISTASEGLPELLTGKNKQFNLLEVPDSSLLLLAGDQTVEHPQRLLDSRRMEHVLQSLREQLDYIVIDTPPAGMLSDAATMAKYVDAAIYVVHQDMASTNQIFESIQTLTAAGTRIIGTVLNGTQQGTTQYGYGSKYGYSYGYGGTYGGKYGCFYGTKIDK